MGGVKNSTVDEDTSVRLESPPRQRRKAQGSSPSLNDTPVNTHTSHDTPPRCPLRSHWAPSDPLDSPCSLLPFAHAVPSFWNTFPCAFTKLTHSQCHTTPSKVSVFVFFFFNLKNNVTQFCKMFRYKRLYKKQNNFPCQYVTERSI